MNQAAAIILAAGQGTRMRSALPKVAHEILGIPLIRYVVDAARTAGVGRIVTVIGHGADAIGGLVDDTEVAVQDEQLGTGHAVRCAEETLSGFEGPVLVLAGDAPLLRSETLVAIVEKWRETGAACVLVTVHFPDPTGYGRIVRDDADGVVAIVEQRDLVPGSLATDECNAGVYCFDAKRLFDALDRVTPHNAQGEYYLTDVVGLMAAAGEAVVAFTVDDADETHGINTRIQLAHAARVMQRRINGAHMLAGVSMTDPDLVWIGPAVQLGSDVVIEPMTELAGSTVVADGAHIGPSTRILDSVVDADAVVEQSVVRGAHIGPRALVGPNAFVRPGTVLGPDTKVGSFVEVKNSRVGEGSKVPHLSYVGDATIGTGVNIGAGSITCNYDGREKHPTVIGDGAFIGSATMLVAPVEIGANAMTAAGSAIAKDVPAGALGIERAEQRTVEGWASRRRAEGDE